MIPDLTNEINHAVKRLGEIAYDKSKEICPVVTGNLKRSITLMDTYDRMRAASEAIIFTNVHYSADVEFGGPYNKPRHYLGGGLEAAERGG